MKDLISVVVIAYNTEDFIEECINSITDQTYNNLEIIVVNDGSKDNTSDVVKKLEKKDSRIKFIDRKINKGTLYTRKEGYDNSTGKYVTFVDSDDKLETDALENMYNEIKTNNYDIVKCGFTILKNGNKTNGEMFSLNEKKVFEKEEFEPEFYDLIYKTIKMNTMCGMLISKNSLKDISKVDTVMIYGEDITNNLYLYNNINSICVIPSYSYIYRFNNASISNTVNEEKITKKIKDAIVTYKKMFEFVDIYKIKDKEKYRAYAADKLKWYVASSMITLCSVKKYKDIKNLIEELKTDNEFNTVIKSSNKNYISSRNKMLRIAINLLFNNKYLLFYTYSKYIYTTLKNLRRKLK